MQDTRGEFLLGMLVGATVGAAFALLYAPSPGTDTRDQVKSTATDTLSKAGDMATSVRDRASEVASKVKEQAQQIAQRGKQAVTEAMDKTEDGDWAEQLPETATGDRAGRRDLHEMQTSDEPDVVSDRINNAMQGSGEEAKSIARDLTPSPEGSGAGKNENSA